MGVTKRTFIASLLASGLPLARAQSGFPSRPITLYCPWPAGGGGDAQLRLLAGATLKQTVLVESRSGAAGSLGATNVVRARPDGYTLSQSHNGALRHPFMVRTRRTTRSRTSPTSWACRTTCSRWSCAAIRRGRRWTSFSGTRSRTRTMDHPEFGALLTSLAQEPISMSGDDYRKYVAEAVPFRKTVVQKYGLKQT